MNGIIKRIFGYKSADFEKLKNYGFKSEGENLVFVKDIAEGQFRLSVTVDKNGEVDTAVTDLETGDPFTLFLVESVTGSFVGAIRAEYESALQEIADKCFYAQVFKSSVSVSIIDYIRDKYGRELEFLWADTPDTAIWRREDNKKWFGALMVVSKRKIGLDSDEAVEIIDLRADPEEIDKIADGKTYFRGYHMNKKHWLTFCLDGSVTAEQAFALIDKSFILAGKK